MTNLEPQMTVIHAFDDGDGEPYRGPDLAMYTNDGDDVVIARSPEDADAVWKGERGGAEPCTATWQRVPDETLVTVINQVAGDETTASALAWTEIAGRGLLGEGHEPEDVVDARLALVRQNFATKGWIDPQLVSTLLEHHASTDIDAYSEPEHLGPTLLREPLRQLPAAPMLVSSELVRTLAHRMLTLVGDRAEMNQRTSQVHPDVLVRRAASIRQAAYELVLFDLCKVLDDPQLREIAGSPHAFLNQRR